MIYGWSFTKIQLFVPVEKKRWPPGRILDFNWPIFKNLLLCNYWIELNQTLQEWCVGVLHKKHILLVPAEWTTWLPGPILKALHHTCDNSQFPGNFPVFRRHKLEFQGNSQFFKPILSQTLKLKSRFQFLFLFYLKRKVVYSAYNSISLCMQASKHKNKYFL